LVSSDGEADNWNKKKDTSMEGKLLQQRAIQVMIIGRQKLHSSRLGS